MEVVHLDDVRASHMERRYFGLSCLSLRGCARLARIRHHHMMDLPVQSWLWHHFVAEAEVPQRIKATLR
eukprot:3023743-Amphidinium_carterae.2